MECFQIGPYPRLHEYASKVFEQNWVNRYHMASGNAGGDRFMFSILYTWKLE